jgi:hypothetical protein
MVEVAVDLASAFALSLFSEARRHHLDLTPLYFCSRHAVDVAITTLLPEFVSTASASPQPLQLVHADHLDPNLLLIHLRR